MIANPREPSPAPPGSSVDDFSLVLGGPVYQVLRRAHLTNDALNLQRRRIVVISLFAWLPLLVFAAIEGHLLGGNIAVPFLMDVEVHVKFLVALPLLIAAELVVHQRMRAIGRMFHERELLPAGAAGAFESAVASAFRLRNSITAELALIALVYLVGITILWRQYMMLPIATWYAIPRAGGSHLTLAGVWYGYVSLPVFQFLLCRWYFRVFIWARLLWQVSRIKLALVPTHPDHLGGLGFLSLTVYAFVPVLLAHGALLSGALASRIFFDGARLTDFRLEILLMVVFLVCLVVGPLLVFSPQLSRAKRTGFSEYGTLAQKYVRSFDTKWLREQGGGEPLLGSSDIQSLADLGNSYEALRQMRVVPVTKEALLHLGMATLAPIGPLVLTMMPLEELIKKLFGILF